MKILFLDDSEIRHRQFIRLYRTSGEIIRVYNVEDALKALNEFSPFDIICLDHDMDNLRDQPMGDNTGYAVARAVSQLPDDSKPERVVVHSFNEEAAPTMLSVLRDSGITSEWFVFSSAEFRQFVSEGVAKYYGHDLIGEEYSESI
jgi:CheY-like chemotaxis protein